MVVAQKVLYLVVENQSGTARIFSSLLRDEIFVFGGMNVQTCQLEAQRDLDGRERLEVLETNQYFQEDR